MRHSRATERGFTMTELVLVMVGGSIIIAMGMPLFNQMVNSYQLVMAGQSIAVQLHYARMKAVASNEEFHVNFPNGTTTYQVENSTGGVIAGPFFLPNGVTWFNGCGGSEVSFGSRFVNFLPTGSIPTSGQGSGGRARIVNTAGTKIDIVVSSGGIIRQTPGYTGCTPAF